MGCRLLVAGRIARPAARRPGSRAPTCAAPAAPATAQHLCGSHAPTHGDSCIARLHGARGGGRRQGAAGMLVAVGVQGRVAGPKGRRANLNDKSLIANSTRGTRIIRSSMRSPAKEMIYTHGATPCRQLWSSSCRGPRRARRAAQRQGIPTR